MNFERLKLFLTVVEAGSVTAVAKAADLAQPALRRNLQLQDWEWASATAAEASGTLPHVLRSLSQARRARGELIRAVLGAVAYPALLTAMAGGLNGTLLSGPALQRGAAPLGRAMLYAPNPYQGGSSVSHFDVTCTPNLLMEPAINADLTSSIDLTRYVF